MVKFLADKAVGFWFTAATALLSVITAIVYAVNYAGFELQGAGIMSWPTFALLLAVAAEIILLTALGKVKYAPYAAGATALVALCLFIHGMYYYVSVMAMGIDAAFNAPFFVNVALVVAVYALAVTSIFLRQEK